MKRITVVGPGAIGGLIASQLERSGTAISVLATARSAQAIRTHGLRVLDGDIPHTTHPRATDDATELGVQDVLLICLKGHALAAAASHLAPLVGARTIIVAAQNGIPWWFFEGLGDQLQAHRLSTVDPDGDVQRVLPPRQCLGCTVYIASWTDADGVIHPGVKRRLVIGEPIPGTSGGAVEQVAGLLERAGFEVDLSAQIHREVWLKLWGNLVVNPLSAITGATVERLVSDPAIRQLASAMMDESRLLATRLGIELGMTTAERMAQLDALGPIKTSMLQDIEAGRAPEIDAIIGAMAEIGDLLRIDTPQIDTVLALVRQVAISRTRP